MQKPLLANRLSRWLVVLVLALLSSSAAWAQSTANYAFTTSSTGSLVDMSSGTTDALATGTYRDDDASAVQAIGFTFGFMGTNYTQFSVNSNGQLRLGATAISGTNATPASGQAILAPFGGDNATQATGAVRYKVVAGTNRTLVVEWTGLRVPYAATPAAGTPTQVQAVLEENTGKIEYRYGTAFNNSTSVTRSIFISAGTSAGQIGVVKTFNATPTYDATVTSATATTLVDNAAIAVLNSTADGARTVFAFTPPSGTPAAPGLAASAVSQTGLTLTVTDNSTNEGFYSLFRSTDNVTFTAIGTLQSTAVVGTGSTLTFAQTGLTPGTTYYYRAVAGNEAGGTSANGTTTATTLAAVPICGTKSVGPNAADYATLTAAFSAVTINGLCGPLVLELQSSYVSTTETFPLVYNYTGATATNTVTVRPAAGATGLSITGTTGVAVMNISGGKYLIIDGRPGGSGATVSGAAATTDLTISSTSTSGIPLQFTADATFNTVQHVQVKGVGTSDSGSPDINFTGTVTATGNSDNTVQYCNIGDGATTPVTLIYGGSTLNSRNSILNNNLFNNYGTASTYGVYMNQAGTGWTIAGNSFYQTASRVNVSGTMYAIYTSGGGHTISGNFIGGTAPGAGGTPQTVTLNGTTAAAYRFVGIYLTTSGAVTSVQGNTVANITWVSSSGASTTYGILSGIYVSTGDINIGTTTGNTVGTAAGPISVSSTTSAGYAFGISTASSGAINIAGNTVSNITGVGAAAVAVNVAGILSSTGSPTINRNKIYTLAAGSAAGGTAATISTGIWLTGGTTNNVSNNLIGDLRATTSTSLAAVSGILVAGGTTNNVAFNTIRLDGTSTGATFGTQGIYLNSLTAGLNLFNNIVVNLSTPVGTGGVATAIRRISGTAGTVPSNLFGNNNLYYAGTPSATNLIYTEGTTTQTNALQTLAAYKAFLLNREANSVTENNTPFASTTGASASFLHLTAGAATQAESGGQPFNGITTDYDGDTRNATTPDIGADEGSFLLTDVTGPTITIVALGGSAGSTTSRTLTTTITDPSGVATGANGPRLYFRKGTTGAFTASAAPTVNGSTYTFTFDYSLIGGVAAGDVVNYYVAAQDALGNASTNPTGGNGATAPSVVYTYTVLANLSGTYYVSATSATSPVPARTYATLTAAVTAYNNSGLGGAVTFLLLDPTYSTSETFPIAILNNTDASATNTLTIRPSNATGTTAFAITGSNATAILQLLASDYVTIDGSLGNTISATDLRPSRDLTITNTNTGTTSIVVQQFAQFTNDGATFNTIKNLTAVGATTATTAATLYGITLQGVSNATTANQYTNNTVQNCAVRGAQVGIGSLGGAIGLKSQNGLITQNDLNASGTTALTRAGIVSSFDNAVVISQNTIDNITFAGTGDAVGISLGFGLTYTNTSFTGSETTNALVSRNYVGAVRQTNTYSAIGIGVATATTGTNTIANNFVTGVIANGTASDFGAGIFVNGATGGGATRVLYNSVSMTGTLASGSQPSLALAIGGTTPTVEIRNNVLLNTQTTGGSSVALGLAYASTTGSYVGLTSSNNAFFVGTGTTFFTGLTGSLGSTGTTRATLTDLSTETGQDRPTTAANPVGTSVALTASPFVSATDLHVSTASAAGLALNNAGVPVSGITVDYDNETRSATTPDIGADEFVTNLDVAAVALVSPVAANQCFTNAETVTVSIRNASTTTALNFATNPVTVTATITGPTPAVLTQVVNTGTLAAGATQSVSFTTTADFSAVGTYSVAVSTTLAGDDNTANNNLAPVAITTAPARVATFAFPNTVLCAGSTATLTPTLGTGATAGTFSASPATGLSLNTSTGVVSAANSTPGTYTVTNTLAAGNGCAVVTATQTVTVAPQTTATFSYASASYCTSGTNPTPSVTGTAGGTFTSTAGLSLNASTGAINLSASSAGTYTVTYAVSGSCPSSATQPVTITLPQTAAFSYAAGANCAGATGTVAATLAAGATAGTFSATPAGLGLNAATGAVNLATSAAGTYTVTNSLPAANGCAPVTSSSTITLNATPSAAFSYSAGTFCLTGTNPTPSITGATGGTFSATPAGLSLNASTGAINLGASTTGTYSVTYAVAATCPASTTVSVTITSAPSAAFTYATGSNCAGTTGTLAPSFGTGSSAGTFSATPAGLTINASSGVVTLGTSTAGTYTVTNTIAAASGCATATASQTLTLNATPVATLAAGGPTTFCAGGSVVLTAPAGTGNTYQFFNGTTSLGAASTTNTLTATAGGSYTVVVTNTATCQATSTATVVTVNPLTTATFSYTGASFCQSGTTNPAATVTGTAGGTFSASPATGLTLNATTGAVTLASSAPGTYTVTYAVSGPCPSTSTQTVTITAAPLASFSYGTSSTYCVSGTTNPVVVLGTGASAGTFSASPATGLTLNATTGAITLASSAPGTYTVTNAIAAANGCVAVTATTTVTITAAPVAAFSYPAATTYCAGSTSTVSPTLGTGATAGTFSSTTGLTINATTGVITLSSSTAGTYTVTNTIAAANGCATATATASVTITPATTATFAYAGATFCATGTNPTPSVTGTAGGTFSSTTGLSINATTGAINLSASTPGTYTVTYTVAGACGSSATATVTITSGPVATFSYGTPSTFCVSGTTAPAVTLGTGASAGTFSSTTGLTINATTGAITLSSSTPGTYTVTNTVAASGGCAATTATASVTITAAPLATFSYGPTSTYCVSGTTAPTVVLGTGATTGTFSSTTGLTINATTGAITLNSSTPGTYTVTNTVAAANGCAATTATTSVTITAAPVATFSYATAAGCVGSTSAATPTLGTGASAGTFSSTAGLTINATTGAITLSTSTAGTYTVTNTLAASGGCGAATATTTFTVNPRPATPTITATYNGTTTTLTSSATTGNQFYLGTNLVTGATGQTLVLTGLPSQLGSYTVTTTNANGCVSLPSNPLVVTSAKSGIAGSSLRLYPNPTPTGQVTLELTGYRVVTQLSVLDALGRVVTSEVLPANNGTTTHALDLSGMATGVYLLRLSNANGVETRRLVRE